MSKQLHGAQILFVEDDALQRQQWKNTLTRHGAIVFAYPTPESALEALAGDEPPGWDDIDFAVLDYTFNGRPKEEIRFQNGLEFAARVRSSRTPPIPIALLTGRADDVFKGRGGGAAAIDSFLSKAAKLQANLADCEKLFAYGRRNRELKTKGEQRSADSRVTETHTQIEDYIAISRLPVLILGETGTGKERIARQIHDNSLLPSDNFRVINCGGLSETLLLSELFGHQMGAFTGADSHKLGVILEAAGVRIENTKKSTQKAAFHDFLIDDCCQIYFDGSGKVARHKRAWTDSGETIAPNKLFSQQTAGYTGTLFLDEVAELSQLAQSALLRFLDGYGIVPIGYSGKPIVPQVRLIAATNRDEYLHANLKSTASEASHGRFRADLLWRLMHWVIRLPSLADRDVAESIRIAGERARSFGERAGSGLGGVSFEFTDDAEEMIGKLIHGKQFSGDTLIQSGNIRALLALVDRTCWRAASDQHLLAQVRDGKTVEGLFRIDDKLIEQSAKHILDFDIGTSEPAAGEAGDSTLESLSGTVLQSLEYLQDAGRRNKAGEFGEVRDGKLQFSSDGRREFEADLTLAKAIRDLLMHSKFVIESGIRSSKFWKQPMEALGGGGVALHGSGQDRWQYVALLGMIAAAGRFHEECFQWKALAELFGEDRSTFAKNCIAETLLRRGIRVAFSGDRRRGLSVPRIDEFLRLLARRSQIVAEEPVNGLQQPQFYWVENVSPGERVAATRFLAYAHELACGLGLARPD